MDKNGKQWPIPHRRIEWTEEEYFVRNRQVRERCFEVCNALKLAFQLNQEPQNVKYFMGMFLAMPALGAELSVAFFNEIVQAF